MLPKLDLSALTQGNINCTTQNLMNYLLTLDPQSHKKSPIEQRFCTPLHFKEKCNEVYKV